MPKHAYSVKEAAEQMSMSKSSVYELMRQGKLGFVMIGRHRVVRAAEIDRYLAAAEIRRAG
ncbi:MAG: excisionase family DNA-binding protein [Negativicutes bacterium]